MIWEHTLDRLSSRQWLGFGFASMVGLAGVDYATGAELSFSLFYLIPISLIAWFVGRQAGIAASCAGAALWLVADVLSDQGYTHAAIPYWNALVRLGFFLVVTHILCALRAARRRQDELLYLIVHDLRSPLSNVRVGFQILQQTAEPKQKDIIEACVVSCDDMFRLINTLLDLSRLESGRMPLHRDDVRVDTLVAGALNQVRLWAEQNQIHLVTDVQGMGEHTVSADAELTGRVLTNLVSNAIKYSPAGATVTVRALPEDDDVAFLVIDQGPGIPAEWAEKVFDKYTQVDSSKLKGVASSGLGLAFCRQAVEEQGGRIWLESAVGQGTTVTFTLPAGEHQ